LRRTRLVQHDRHPANIRRQEQGPYPVAVAAPMEEPLGDDRGRQPQAKGGEDRYLGTLLTGGYEDGQPEEHHQCRNTRPVGPPQPLGGRRIGRDHLERR
jgi:hypothetical protein